MFTMKTRRTYSNKYMMITLKYLIRPFVIMLNYNLHLILK